MARWYSANVLESSSGGRRLWNLAASGSQFSVTDEKSLLLNEPCPPAQVGKDWHTLFRKKLNVAWLPPEAVFFRSVQLPSSDPAEIASMVELQLEKLSPLPVTHIVWSIYLMPKPADKPDSLQTVIVLIAARSAVEEFLGQLEGEGFLADRLEAPGLEQMLTANVNEDGIWVFGGPPGQPAITLWWYGGTIQNLTLVALSPGPERGAELKTQLEQVAWAAEVDGWLNGPLRLFLLVGPDDAEFWVSVFKDWAESIEVIRPPAAKELAALSAERCASGTTGTSLLPPEFAARYHSQFVDRIWMRAAVGVVGLYVMVVLFYFGMLYVYDIKIDAVKKDLANMGPAFTNSLKDVEQIHILEDREALKFAGLDCWKAVAENVPESITVDSLFFRMGKLELRGSVVPDDREDVGSFNEKLRSATGAINHEPLFSDVSPPTLQVNNTRGDWTFNCTLLKGGESP